MFLRFTSRRSVFEHFVRRKGYYGIIFPRILVVLLIFACFFIPEVNAQSIFEEFDISSSQDSSQNIAPLPKSIMPEVPIPPQVSMPPTFPSEVQEQQQLQAPEQFQTSEQQQPERVPSPLPPVNPNRNFFMTPEQATTLRMLGQTSTGNISAPTPPNPFPGQANLGNSIPPVSMPYNPYNPYVPTTPGYPLYSQYSPSQYQPYPNGNDLVQSPYLGINYGNPYFFQFPQQQGIMQVGYGTCQPPPEQTQTVPEPGNTNSSFVNSPYMPVRSPLLETTFATASLMNPFNAPHGIHRGVGEPLENESWLDHPYYVGVFGGWICGDALVEGILDQGSGGNGGIMAGWNINHYWGLEARLMGASLDLEDMDGNSQGTNKLTVLDISMHYYPFGEARWRPYLKLGIGTLSERFLDQDLKTLSVPLGIGVKYFWSDRMAVHLDLVDNVIFGKGPTRTHSNVSVNFGVSYMFGTNPNRHPVIYWPYTPSEPY